MKKEMFSDLIKETKPTRKWLFLPISFTLHAMAIAALIVSPLLTVESLPPVKTLEIVMVEPVKLSVPVGPKASSSRKNTATKAETRKPSPKPSVVKDVLTAPPEIPEDIPEEEIDFSGLEIGNGDGDGLVDGAPEGDPNGPPGALPGSGTNTTPLHITRVEQIPRVIKKVAPEYPALAARARVQGRVVIEAETDIYGRVIRTRVVQGNPLLNQAAEAAVRSWVYEPYIINGNPRPVRFVVELNFTLNR